MRFEECLNEHGLGKLIDDSYGKWGFFSEQAARKIIEAVRLEVREPGSEALISLASQLAFTWLNESVYNMSPQPNKNGHSEDVTKWDIGPGQLNVFWTRKTAEIGEIPPLDEAAVFGSFHPEKFDGDVIANLRTVCRVLLAIRAGRDKPGISESLMETQVSHYCGPNSRPFRRAAWQKFGGLFKEFYGCYEALA